MTEIAGSTTLITGGGSGMGRLLGLGMARLGGRIVLWDIDPEALDRVTREIKEATGRDAYRYVCDVSDRAHVYEVAERVHREVGEVDIVVNNAGIVSGRPFLDNPDEHVERTFAVNALALFWVTKAFLPQMVERDHGHLVTVVSASAISAPPRLTDYGASKWAAAGFDEALRNELRTLAPHVRTTAVFPYYVDTGMFGGVAPNRVPWLLPIQRPKRVVTKIVDGILRDKRRLVIPPIQLLGWVSRWMPPDWFDAQNAFLGIHTALDHFVGRSGARDPFADRTRPEDLDALRG